jgi:pimeloyl-ACP methyl ester carboxylesterase
MRRSQWRISQHGWSSSTVHSRWSAISGRPSSRAAPWSCCTAAARPGTPGTQDKEYGIDALVSDLRFIVATLDRPPVLVGASMGGSTALVGQGENPGLAGGLVLVDIVPRIEPAGVAKITAFMNSRPDGFESLAEVAEVVRAYNPHRKRPPTQEGLRKNVRQRADGRWYWHWDPAFIGGKLGGADETRASLVDPVRLKQAALGLTLPTLLVRGRVSDLLSEEGAQELLQLVPHAQMVDVAGAGHMVAGDRNDLFNDAVVTFLESVHG